MFSKKPESAFEKHDLRLAEPHQRQTPRNEGCLPLGSITNKANYLQHPSLSPGIRGEYYLSALSPLQIESFMNNANAMPSPFQGLSPDIGTRKRPQYTSSNLTRGKCEPSMLERWRQLASPTSGQSITDLLGSTTKAIGSINPLFTGALLNGTPKEDFKVQRLTESILSCKNRQQMSYAMSKFGGRAAGPPEEEHATVTLFNCVGGDLKPDENAPNTNK